MNAARRPGQAGAALLSAMLTVTLVASLSTTVLWQQWRSIEIERAERTRSASHWVLVGALDWARLILREDARNGGADHLAEPWAVPLQDARLATFLAGEQAASDDTDDLMQAFLSGQISDLQGRLNVNNLVLNHAKPQNSDNAPGDKSPDKKPSLSLSQLDLADFSRLFEALGLPPSELMTMAENLRLAHDTGPQGSPNPLAPLPPQRVDQLTWLGLSQRSLALLRPHITLLPVATPVNLNTADALVLTASIGGLGLAQAQQMVSARQRSHFRTLADAGKLLPSSVVLDEKRHAVSSRFFEVSGRLRLDDAVVQEQSVVQRDGVEVRVLWRERTPPVATASSTSRL